MGTSPHPFFTGETERRTVPCVTLDALAARYGKPDLVKVDTEGSEVLVLRGGASLMGQAQWLIEWHSPALRDACRDLLAEYEQEVIPFPGGTQDYGGETQNGWLLAKLPEGA
jgi:hypothetical protein